jgi:hypothetical protein
MHTRPLILACLLLAAGSSEAAVRNDAKTAKNSPCVLPPVPPAPPAAPAPPAPPAAEADMPLPPLAPVPPAPPAPPAIGAPPAPPLPAVPADAHAACAGRANGSVVSWTLGPGETMRGRCERADGRMVFQLRSYRKTG